MTLLVTGGAGFIGAISCWTGSPVRARPSSTSTSSPTRATPRRWPRWPTTRGTSCAGRHLRRRCWSRRLLADHRPRRHRQFRRRVARGPLHPRARRLHADQRDGRVHAAGSGAGLITRGLAGRAAGAFRFLHVSTDEVYGSLAPEAPPSRRRTRTRPTAVLGRRRRPPTIRCACLAPHLRPAGARPPTAPTTTGRTSSSRS